MTSTDFSETEYKLYGRQMILPEVGVQGQGRLKQARVAVVGAGGLGSPALLYLAGAGVGQILIIDDDRVEASNLHRQIIHTFSGVGNLKAESAALALRALNPMIEVETCLFRVTDENAGELLAGVDLVVDGSDNFATRYTVSRACAALGVPHVWGAILGFDAQMSVFWAGRGPVYEDLYPVEPAPGSVPNCATAGVLGALAGVVGTAMALEATKVLMGIGSPLVGKVAYFSGLEGTWDYIPLVAGSREVVSAQGAVADGGVMASAENLSSVGPALEMSWTDFAAEALEREVFLLDVREEHEHRALAVPGSSLLALSEIKHLMSSGGLSEKLEEVLPADVSRVGVYCAGGFRSLEAVEILRGLGEMRAVSLTGGISEWLMGK